MITEILVVEDDSASRILLQSFDKHLIKYHFSFAHSLAEAKIAMEKKKFAVVVLDLGLPDSKGLNTFHDLHQFNSQVPYVIMSGNSDDKLVEQALKMGAQDYLVKGNMRISELPRLFKYVIDRFSLVCQLEKSHRELIESHQRFEEIFEGQREGIVVIDAKGEILMANRAAKNLNTEALYPLLQERISAAENSLCENEPFDLQLGENSDARVLRTEIEELCWGGKPVHVAHVRDVTDRLRLEQFEKKAEAEQHQQQRLESIGQLAAGVAHEINTPSQYVSDNLEFLEDGFQSFSQLYEYFSSCRERLNPESDADLIASCEELERKEKFALLFEEIPEAITESREGVDHITSIVKSLKDFSHVDGEKMLLAELDKRIESTVSVCRNEWKGSCDINLDFDPNLGRVLCFSGLMSQVVMNLIVNAAHAIEDLQEQNKSDEKGLISIHCHRLEQNEIELRVSDNGIGISDDIRGRVFDPFFTTKEVGRGTGQGLAMIHNIVVNKHQGTLDFESTPGQGTTFIIRLPQ